MIIIQIIKPYWKQKLVYDKIQEFLKPVNTINKAVLWLSDDATYASK